MIRDKQNIKTTDWLIRGIPEEQLKREKREAIKEAEAELRNKQIEEMRYLADEMGKAISTELEKRYLADEQKLEEVLKANGWRKSTDLAEEIFAEIDEIFERQIYESRWLDQNSKVLGVVDVFYAFECWRDYIKPELKKKYTESEKDDEQR